MASEIRPLALYTTMSRQGVLFLWPVKLPGPDGRDNSWNVSAIDAVAHAKDAWVRVSANMPLGAYEIFEAAGPLEPPSWPELSMKEILSIAFRDHYIASLDHPVLKKLRGET